MKVSDKGIDFITTHEGIVLNAYRDPVGIVTIGVGFTNRSRIFREYWMQKHGRKLKLGDVITPKECIRILRKLVDEEYGSYVNSKAPHLEQHEYDACVSMVYNCGPKSLEWKWFKALQAGDVRKAASLLQVTATTARGKKLAGLVRRRREEAELLSTGHYAHPRFITKSKDFGIVKEYQQQLIDLGYLEGDADGIPGPKTKKAILDFQRRHPRLTPDGKFGPATSAALLRAVLAQKSAPKKEWSIAIAGALAIYPISMLNFNRPALYVCLIVVILAIIGWSLWPDRDELRTFNK